MFDRYQYSIAVLLVASVFASPAMASFITLTGTAGNDLLKLTATGPDSALLSINSGGPISENGITGIEVNGGDGSDRLIIDQSASLFSIAGGLTFNGEGQSGLSGDTLEFTGGRAISSSFEFFNESDGRIDTDNMTITYTGLEPITFLMTVDDLVFDYRSNGVDTITLSDSAAGLMSIDSTSGELVEFNIPLSHLTILFDENDSFVLNDLDPAFDRSSLRINPVPLPAGIWLFGTALIGLFGINRRRRPA